MLLFYMLPMLATQTPLGGYELRANNTTIESIAEGSSVVYHPSEWPNIGFAPHSPWDWSQERALEFDVRNPGETALNLGVRFDDDASADGWRHSRTGTILVPGRSSKHAFVVFGPDPISIGMRGLPPIPGGVNASAVGDGGFDLRHVVALQFFMHDVKADTRIAITDVRTVSGSGDSLNKIVDAYGQYAKAEWPGKVHSTDDLTKRLAIENQSLHEQPAFPDRDKFGGFAGSQHYKATGFFRTEKVDGKWWLVDPAGHLFFSFGIDTIQPDESTFITGREKMFSWLPSSEDPLHRFQTAVSGMHSGPVTSGDVFNFYGANLYRKFGENYLKAWREETLARLPSWGFNTIGNWSDEGFYGNNKVPYVATGGIEGSHARVSSGSDYWSKMHDPFDPQFKSDVTKSLSHLVSTVMDDPYCLGYFIDNELSWAGDGPDGRYGLALSALKLGFDSPAKIALFNQIHAKYADIADLNAAWQTGFSSWDVLRKPTEIKTLTDGERKDFSVYVYRFALKYFSTIRDELKRLDPDHLYMGCRFAWFCPEAEQAAADVCDVISYNIYAPKLDPEKWDRVAKFNKPCIIGEFHFGALNRGMFHPGLVSTPNQAARAAMYEEYVGSVLKNPSFVGCHWFQYTDEPLTGRSWDGENYNIGMVSVTDTPYPEMIQAAKRVQGEGYRIRLGLE